MSETGMNWYVLRAVSGKEGKVKEFIEAAKKHNDVLNASVGEILLPTEKYAMMRNGKRVIKEKLFLPGYVLIQARLQGEVAHMLRFIPNVLGFPYCSRPAFPRICRSPPPTYALAAWQAD